jgi:hypothetical protein
VEKLLKHLRFIFESAAQLRCAYFLFLSLLPVFLAGCIASLPYPEGATLPQPTPVPQVRSPKVGQEWVYQVRNVFNQEVVDTVTERVVSVGEQVRIARFSAKTGPLPDELQSPWGYILQDPHWNPPQKFTQALPLWPEQLNARWSGYYRTRYQVLGYPEATYYWGLNMDATEWERMTVPAGSFDTLKFRNIAPFFESYDVFRTANYREEDIWIAPEVGRWVIRRGYGRYLTAGMFWSNAYWEDYLEWELVSWK